MPNTVYSAGNREGETLDKSVAIQMSRELHTYHPHISHPYPHNTKQNIPFIYSKIYGFPPYPQH